MCISQIISGKVYCSHLSKNYPSHGQVIPLIEHVLDSKDELLFCMHMKLLKHSCMFTAEIFEKTCCI